MTFLFKPYISVLVSLIISPFIQDMSDCKTEPDEMEFATVHSPPKGFLLKAEEEEKMVSKEEQMEEPIAGLLPSKCSLYVI